MPKVRIDVLLVERGLADSRSQAQRIVMAGQVRAAGQVVFKPSTTVQSNVLLEVDQGPPYVSRGGEKLAAALQAFDIAVAGRVCADVGASTGGFTDCLLQNGAKRVYAIDVGQGILHWKLRQDRRVVVLERTNARYLERLIEPVSLVSIDASFISLKLLLPVVHGWLGTPGQVAETGSQVGPVKPKGDVLALIKPQFEAGRAKVRRGDGVIRDPQVHQEVLAELLGYAKTGGYGVQNLLRSPLLGPKGNVEFLAWLVYPGPGLEEWSHLIQEATGL